MGNIEITTKFSRLKSVSSIDGDYLETATGGDCMFLSCHVRVYLHIILWVRVQLQSLSHWRCSIKKAALKNLLIFTGKQLCWSPYLIKLQACKLLKRDSNTGIFLCVLENF